MNEIIRGQRRPGVALRCTPAPEETFPSGATRIGGWPDLPAETPWPTAIRRAGAWRVDVGEVRLPLAFVAQLDLAEVAAFSDELPPEGLLSIFMLDDVRAHAASGHVDADAPDRTAVIYTPTATPLVRLEPPAELPGSCRGAPARVAFERVSTWPLPEGNVISSADHPIEGTLVLDRLTWERWMQRDVENPPLQLLGHPAGCEYPIGVDPATRLLLSLEAEESGLPWELFGRNGFLFFRIPAAALRARQWSEARHKEW